MTTVRDLDTLHMDIEVASPTEYVDGTLPMLVPEGPYDLLITEWDISRNRETKEPDGKAFILQTEITGGEYDGRAVRNLRIWTTTFQRNGVTVSGLGDLVRAIDDTAHFRNLSEAANILQEAQDKRLPFRVKLVWEAYDSDFYREKGGDNLVRKSPEEKALRSMSTIKGMTKFRQAPDGTFIPEVEGPSGNTLEARLTIDRYIPSSKRR